MYPNDKYARTTISIPPELKQRMELRKDTNWSALASQAFQARLDEQTSKGSRMWKISECTWINPAQITCVMDAPAQDGSGLMRIWFNNDVKQFNGEARQRLLKLLEGVE